MMSSPMLDRTHFTNPWLLLVLNHVTGLQRRKNIFISLTKKNYIALCRYIDGHHLKVKHQNYRQKRKQTNKAKQNIAKQNKNLARRGTMNLLRWSWNKYSRRLKNLSRVRFWAHIYYHGPLFSSLVRISV